MNNEDAKNNANKKQANKIGQKLDLSCYRLTNSNFFAFPGESKCLKYYKYFVVDHPGGYSNCRLVNNDNDIS
jgi:hypothetical protein